MTGGTGSDTLTITLDTTNDTALAPDLTNVTGFETLTIGSNVAAGITLSENNIADGGSLTVNASAMTSVALTFNASNDTDGSVSITAGGSGDHQITLSQGNDTYLDQYCW